MGMIKVFSHIYLFQGFDHETHNIKYLSESIVHTEWSLPVVLKRRDTWLHLGTTTPALFPFALWPFALVPFALSRHLLYTSFALYAICSIRHLLYD